MHSIANPSVGDVIYQESRLHHPRLDWSVCKFQACDRYRESRYSPHTSDVQYAYVRYSLLYHILLLSSRSHFLVCNVLSGGPV